MNDTIYTQISFTRSLSNDSHLNRGYNLKIFWVEMTIVTEKDDAEHIIRLPKAIPASLVQAIYAQLPIIILGLWNVLRRMKKWRVMRMVGK